MDEPSTTTPIELDGPVDVLPGIGPGRKALLAQLGIETIRDLLFHLPRTYQDRRHIARIADVTEGQAVTIQGVVASSRNVRFRGRMSMALVEVSDGTGSVKASFFGRGFLANTVFAKGAKIILTGRVAQFKGLTLKDPDYEMLGEDEDDRLNTGCVAPVYRLTEKLTQRVLRRWVATALDYVAVQLPEPLQPEILKRHDWLPVQESIREVHFPSTVESGQAARQRFAYEELLGLQLSLLGERAERMHEEQGCRHLINGPHLKALGRALPFELTRGQERAIADVLADMAQPRPMARLVQGDVGCGKTVVALHAIAAAADGGFQTALMAPTEILAEQHGLQLRALLEPFGLRVETLMGAARGATAIRKRIAAGEADVIVGTQALYQEKTKFHRLGLVIIDEQHRFGVLQRGRLTEKGLFPDVLHMTATPIPRTLAITVYGGMDLSVIEEMPPGRLPVKTRQIPPAKIPGLYEYIRKEAAHGRQTYIVCPLVDESEKREDLTPVIRHFDDLNLGPLGGLRTGLLHGRLDTTEKDTIMAAFKRREIDVLFSTTVIEVGIDVPSATTMVIEDAGQFGLTQLHQLRGRVGRGAEQSHCFLCGTPKTAEGKQRLDIFCACNNGFEIAEQDLKLRGPGEFHGVRQAGLSDLQAADLLRDVRLLDLARRDAQTMLEANPHARQAWQGLGATVRPTNL